MSIGKVIGYSIFGVAAAAVGTIVIAVGALAGFVALNQKAFDVMFGKNREQPEVSDPERAS